MSEMHNTEFSLVDVQNLTFSSRRHTNASRIKADSRDLASWQICKCAVSKSLAITVVYNVSHKTKPIRNNSCWVQSRHSLRKTIFLLNWTKTYPYSVHRPNLSNAFVNVDSPIMMTTPNLHLVMKLRTNVVHTETTFWIALKFSRLSQHSP